MAEYEIRSDGNTVTVKKKTGLGCCNMLIWDSLVILFFCLMLPYAYAEYLPFEIHIVFRIIIGIILCAVFFFLFRIKYLGAALNVLLGLVWAFILYSAIEDLSEDGVMSTLLANDPIWWWTAVILGSAFFIGLHFASSQEMGATPDADYTDDVSDYQAVSNTAQLAYPASSKGNLVDNRTQNYAMVYKRFEDVADVIKTMAAKGLLDEDTLMHIDTIIDKFNEVHTQLAYIINNPEKISPASSDLEMLTLKQETYLRQLKKLMDEAEPTTTINSNTSNTGVSYFAGCDTVEKLKKRYKGLVKNYHPDTDIGDKESMQLINDEYERLLKEMEN